MKWILENLGRNNDTGDLDIAIKKAGDEVIILNPGNFDPKNYPKNEKVVFIGSIQTANFLKRELSDCEPVVWYTSKNYLCSNYYCHYYDLLFNDEHSFIPFGGLKQNKWHFYKMYSKEAVIFIRPDSGEKSFTGHLLDLKDFDRYLDIWKSNGGIKDSDLIIISSPKNIKGEWRFVCSSDGDIVASSSYLYDGLQTYVGGSPLGAIEKCQEVLSRNFFPDRFFTVDIAQGADNRFYLLELNSFNSAGLYACDKNKVVTKIKKVIYENNS